MERWTIRAFQGPCSLSSRARTFRRRSTEKSGRVDVGTAGKCGQAPPSMGHAPQMLHARLETVVCRPGHGRLHGLQPAQESEPRRSDLRTLAEAVRGLQAWSACYMFKAADEQWVASAAGGDACGMSFSRHKRASWPTTVRMLPQQEYQESPGVLPQPRKPSRSWRSMEADWDG